MGEQAEQWTASVLRGLPGRRLANHLKPGQPTLITSWSAATASTPWNLVDSNCTQPRKWRAKAARQAARNAKDLGLWNQTRLYGPAQPVVMIWGPAVGICRRRELSRSSPCWSVPTQPLGGMQ